MNKEDLKKLGIEDEKVIEQIIILHGKGIESSKASLAATQAELATAKTQLAEAGSAIEGFKKMDVEGIKKAADEWKAKAEQAQTEAANQVAQLKFDYALTEALSGAKAKNAKAVKALLNTNDLKLGEDGALVGLSEQLAKVKSENSFLFDDEAPSPKIVAGGGSNQSVIGDAVVEAARKAAGLPPAK